MFNNDEHFEKVCFLFLYKDVESANQSNQKGKSVICFKISVTIHLVEYNIFCAKKNIRKIFVMQSCVNSHAKFSII